MSKPIEFRTPEKSNSSTYIRLSGLSGTLPTSLHLLLLRRDIFHDGPEGQEVRDVYLAVLVIGDKRRVLVGNLVGVAICGNLVALAVLLVGSLRHIIGSVRAPLHSLLHCHEDILFAHAFLLIPDAR